MVGATKLGTEFQVNTDTTGNQLFPSVTALVGGGFVVAWQSGDDGDPSSGSFAQLYDISGVPIGSQFALTPQSSGRPALEALEGGGFVATWISAGQRYFQAHASNGDSVGPTVNLGDSDDLGVTDSASISGLSGGGYVVVWQNGGIYLGQVFSPAGVPVSTQLTIGPSNMSFPEGTWELDVAALTDGRFAVTWYDGVDVWWRLYDANGMSTGVSSHISPSDSNQMLRAPEIAALEGGGFVLTWTSEWYGDPGVTESAVLVQVFDNSGVTKSPIIEASGPPSFSNTVSRVTALDGGGFVVLWHSFTNGLELVGQVFDSNGASQGQEFIANSYLNGSQQHPSVAGLDGGGFVVTWMSSWQDGSQWGVYGQRFGAEINSTISVSIADAIGFEGSKLAFKVELSAAATADVTVGFETHSGTAIDGVDFAGMTGVLNIAAGDRSGYIYIDATSDGISESDQSFAISITAPSGVVVGDGTATGTIKDLKTASELFDGRYLQTMAEFAFAAYHLGDWEPSNQSELPRPDLNNVSAGAERTYNQLEGAGWHFLSATELAMPLAFQTLQPLASGFVVGFKQGIFTNENAAALVARSSDALVISFRGTNDKADLSFDHADWLNFERHYGYFGELISALKTYIEDNSISQVYVTGHSLGASMVEAFLGQHFDTADVKYDGVTLASPGFWEADDLVTYNYSRLIQFHNVDDPIIGSLPLTQHELTGDTNELYFGEVKAASNSVTQHSMALYLAITEEMFASGVPYAALEGTGGWFDYDNMVTIYTVIDEDSNLYSIAKGKDVLYGRAGSSLSFDLLFGGAGDDVLDGRDGRDALFGGADNDTYVLGNEASGNDRVEDTAGVDTITTTINRSLAFADYSEIENLTLLAGATTGVGNALRNTITGNAANNTLNGLTNVDRLVGGSGNDTYYVDATIDTVVEAAGAAAGTADRVIFTGSAGQTYVLAANVELLTLAGSAASPGTGNALANTITGNSAANILNGAGNNDILIGGAGNDTLIGSLGNDTLTGGMGNDFFLFNTTPNASTNRDHIVDFSVPADTIRLENAIFTQLTATGMLAASKFAAGTVAAPTDNHPIYYNKPTGGLFYDSNGAAAGGDVQFATLAPNLALTRADFFVV